MPLRSDWPASVCPIARSLEVVGDPWVLLILRNALLGARHYERFRAELGIAYNALSRRLQAMVDAGLLRQVLYRGPRRTHLEYHLTEAGADLLPVLQALAWRGDTHTSGPVPAGAWASSTAPAATPRPRPTPAATAGPCSARPRSPGTAPGAHPRPRPWLPPTATGTLTHRGDRVELPDPASPLVERIRTSVLGDREVMDGPYGPAVVHAAPVSD
jgi:DNA-binding HxlR family transcriptional regulator